MSLLSQALGAATPPPPSFSGRCWDSLHGGPPSPWRDRMIFVVSLDTDAFLQLCSWNLVCGYCLCCWLLRVISVSPSLSCWRPTTGLLHAGRFRFGCIWKCPWCPDENHASHFPWFYRWRYFVTTVTVWNGTCIWINLWNVICYHAGHRFYVRLCLKDEFEQDVTWPIMKYCL